MAQICDIAVLRQRRLRLGMSYTYIARLAGLSPLAIRRFFNRPEKQNASPPEFIRAIAEILGCNAATLHVLAEDELCRLKARGKAERIVRMVQATSGLEGQAVDEGSYLIMVERTIEDLVAGPRRRLWSE